MKPILLPIIFLGYCLSYASQFVADSNTVALWHLNEGSGAFVYDSSNNKNMGLINGATWVDGITSKGLSFVGSGKYVKIPDAPTLSMPATGKMTLEVWVKFNSLSLNNREIINKGDPRYNGGGYELSIFNSKICLFGFSNSANEEGASISIDSLSTGCWYYLAGVFDGTITKLYINGKLRATDTFKIISAITPGTTALTIGNWDHPNYDRTFDGIIDEIRISDVARTSYEISENALQDSNIIAIWNFNENIGDTLYDKSTFGNNGIINNAKWCEGIEGSALSFNGMDDYVFIGDKLDMGGANFSLSAWVKIDSLTRKYMTIANKHLNGSSAGYAFGVSDSGHIFGFIGDNSNYLKATNDGLRLSYNKWHNITVVFNRKSYMTRYLDGNVDGSINLISQITGNIESALPLCIGAKYNNNAPVEYFNGKIDDVSFYNKALSAIEVENLYNTNSTRNDELIVPSQINCIEASPNPFNPAITITLKNAGNDAVVNIFSLNGQNVASLTSFRKNQFKWVAKGQPSGIYIVRALIENRTYSKTIFLLK